ncbi:MAG TPA: adenylate/guanylate cyclase domain-containing protein [Anaerolineales bacterium]
MEGRFEILLVEYLEAGEDTRRKTAEAVLWKEFGVTGTVLVMDLSRFSTLTEKYGIVYNLALIRQMQITARPLIEAAGGRVVKFEADNCFALFKGVLPAIRAAIDIHRALQELNTRSADPFEIRVGIGIDHGEVLLIGENDFFGLPVNRASKLGEDLAGAGDILVTQTAYQTLPPGCDIQSEPLNLSVSGLNLDILSIKY